MDHRDHARGIGRLQLTSANLTSANPAKRVVQDICALFEQQRGMEAAERYFSPDYVEHNPEVPGGNLEGFKQVLVRERIDRPGLREVKLTVLKLFAEGDEVCVHMLCEEPGNPPISILEIYRVENGLVVEHWDAMHVEDQTPMPASA